MAPSLCGSVVSSKRSLLAQGWTLTSLLSLAAFVSAAMYAVHVRTHYRHVAQTYANNNDDYGYNNYNCDGGDGGEGCRSHDSRDSHDEAYYYNSLASVSSGSMTFAGIYTATVAVGLSLYGSLAIVGFSSVRGQYIAPCLGVGGTAVQSRIHLGIFMGALILFSCMCLVCAVVFGEFRVEDNIEDERVKDEADLGTFAVEKIASVLAGLCMFLAVLYFSYSVLLFSFKDEIIDDMMGDFRKDMVELGGIGGDRGGRYDNMDAHSTLAQRAAAQRAASPALAGSALEYQPPHGVVGVGVGVSPGQKIVQDSTGFISTGTESYD